MRNFRFSSESVSEGHPDKVADQISDAILDAHLSEDPLSRVACETLVKNDNVIIAGEITSNCSVDYDGLIRKVINSIGYDNSDLGFSAETCEVLAFTSLQSNDISQGVNEKSNKEQGAGDQGLMFGFACDETPELMPLPIALAHRLVKMLSEKRKAKAVDFLRPDAKSQVTVEYRNGKPFKVDTIIVSTQHKEEVRQDTLKTFIIDELVPDAVPSQFLSKDTRYLVNPTGRFVIGGPVGDCGVTGRKIIVDTYGGYSRHGGGAFSGKDPSKVDRSGAYAARYVAKNIVSAGLAKRCEVQLAYAIGISEPVSLYVDTFGTGIVAEERLVEAVRKLFPLSPKGIIQHLNLLRPIYQRTASYGHFGRSFTQDGHFSWERTDKAQELRMLLG
ncbi:MAG: methionine adenosyltransferase [SAR324 cluster bacterium]|uniref:S-adenosylmethionine synthase n=1 Tax=SAR324 cluster bacterium TaxID=2024889 RepID=A0A7X9IKH7_9DELT|nr:methionine adenosyltransferase [SAR324 cluster bacterium]